MGTTSLTWPKRTMPANAAARRSCKFGPTVPGDFYINCELDIVVKFAVDLYGAFPVKRLFWVVLPVLCSERERPFFVPSPAIRFAERAEGGKGTGSVAQ